MRAAAALCATAALLTAAQSPGVAPAPPSSPGSSTNIDFMNCEIKETVDQNGKKKKEIGECDTMSYLIEKAIMPAVWLLLGIIAALACPLFFCGRHCCNCCGGPEQTPGYICCPPKGAGAKSAVPGESPMLSEQLPSKQIAEQPPYSDSHVMKTKAAAVACFLLAIVGMGVGISSSLDNLASFENVFDGVDGTADWIGAAVDGIVTCMKKKPPPNGVDCDSQTAPKECFYNDHDIISTFGTVKNISVDMKEAAQDGRDDTKMWKDLVYAFSIVGVVLPAALLLLGVLWAGLNCRKCGPMITICLLFMVIVPTFMINATANGAVNLVVTDLCAELDKSLEGNKDNVIQVLIDGACDQDSMDDAKQEFEDNIQDAKDSCTGVCSAQQEQEIAAMEKCYQEEILDVGLLDCMKLFIDAAVRPQKETCDNAVSGTAKGCAGAVLVAFAMLFGICAQAHGAKAFLKKQGKLDMYAPQGGVDMQEMAPAGDKQGAGPTSTTGGTGPTGPTAAATAGPGQPPPTTETTTTLPVAAAPPTASIPPAGPPTPPQEGGATGGRKSFHGAAANRSLLGNRTGSSQSPTRGASTGAPAPIGRNVSVTTGRKNSVPPETSPPRHRSLLGKGGMGDAGGGGLLGSPAAPAGAGAPVPGQPAVSLGPSPGQPPAGQPPVSPGPSAEDLALPEGWHCAKAPNTGRIYYYNYETQERRWRHPNADKRPDLWKI